MWTHSIKLPLTEEKTYDEDGFPKDTVYTYLEGIPASITGTTRNDETLANQLGYTADLNVGIRACNYSGQAFLVDEATGDIYDIERTYRRDKSDMLVLTVQRRERGKEV